MAKDIAIIPSVSVVMSVYNGSEYIDAAIKSILNQTFKDFEFIIVNDGSTDDSLKKIQSYKDSRIKIISQDNKGLVASLNTAIAASITDNIARQDADDISVNNRLQAEYDAMHNNPEVVLLGSSIITIDENSKVLNQHKVLLNNSELKQELLVRSPFAHGSVMFNKDAFIKAGGYKQNDWPAEDYGLWVRMANHGGFMNIDEPLYKYRENTQGISAVNQHRQQEKTESIQNDAWLLKNEFIGKRIYAAKYHQLDMGEYRIERIVHNLLFALKKSVKYINLITAVKIIFMLISDKNLLRKSTRMAMIKLKLKHV